MENDKTKQNAVRSRVVVPVLLSLAVGLVVSAGGSQAMAAAQAAGVASISAGDAHTCAIESGGAYCWGNNASGQLGNGSTASSAMPVAVDTSGVLAGKTLTQISSGGGHTCALDSSGAAYCWGYNLYGQLGDGTTADSSVPVAVDTSGALAGKTLTQISAGELSTCAIDSTGAAYCWGENPYGQLGDGTTDNSSFPVAVDTSGVLAGQTLTQIAAGFASTCALVGTGTAYCWGGNYTGQLGDGDTDDSDIPVAVDTSGVLAGQTLTQIAIGDDQACAVDTAGAAFCWGYNAYGQLGDGSTATSDVPVAVDTSGVLAGKTITQVTAGWQFTCALDSTGAGYCWGDNFYGGLGDGTTASSDVPVTVDTSGALAGRTLTQVSAYADHACAVDSTGAAFCWGDDLEGDLGNGSTAQSDVPVLAGPQAPTNTTAVPGDRSAAISWTAPASLDGGTLIAYTATASPGDRACTTTGASTCTITGLKNGTTYAVSVADATTAGDSGASTTISVTPGSPVITSVPSYTATVGDPFRFPITATGTPLPKITKLGKLPRGVIFTNTPRGTATIAGTPHRMTAGSYQLTLTAKNRWGIATQAFILTVTRRSQG